MPRLFSPDAVADELRDLGIVGGSAEQGAGVPFRRRKEAVAELALGGDT